MLCEFLRTHEGESTPSCYEVGNAFVLALLHLDQFWDTNLTLVVQELSNEFLLHCLPVDNRVLQEAPVLCEGCSLK